MPTRTSQSRVSHVAYVMDEESLRQVAGILFGISDQIEYTIECSDGSSIDYSLLDDVLAFQNPKNRRVTGLSLNTSWQQEPHIQMRFKGRSAVPIEYTVRGEEKDVFYLSGRLDEAIAALRRWYSPVAYFDFMWAALVGFLLGTIATLVVAAWTRRSGGESIRSDLLTLALFLTAILAVLALGALLNFVRNRLFPVAAFAIGGGAARYGLVVFWRRALGIGFVLALLASVAATWIVK